jgi:hypothetical protein
MVERLHGMAGVELTHEVEFVRNHLLKALLEWDRESARIEAEVRAKILGKPRKPVEGSREWDLLFAEEMERAYAALAARGG